MGQNHTFRKLERTEYDTWIDLMDSAYGPMPSPPAWRAEEMKAQVDNAWGLFVGGELVSSLLLLPYAAYHGKRVIRNACVAGVATAPQWRRRGYAQAMFREALAMFREEGYPLSSLYPFSYAFYRQLGWEYSNDVMAYELELPNLPLGGGNLGRPGAAGEAVPPAGPGRARILSRVRPDEPENVDDATIELVRRVYTPWAQGFNGMLDRSERRWRRDVFRAGRYLRTVAVWEDEHGTPRGYIAFAQEGAMSEKPLIWVREMAALDDQAYRGLLAFLRNEEAQYVRLELQVPPTDPLPFYLDNPRFERKLKPGAMLRVIDLPAALEATAQPAPGAEGALTLVVHDPLAAWNDGQWRVSVEGGRVAVDRMGNGTASASTAVPAAGAGPRVELGIGTLAQIIYNHLTAERAHAIGRLEASDDRAVALLGSLFGRRPSYLSDFF